MVALTLFLFLAILPSPSKYPLMKSLIYSSFNQRGKVNEKVLTHAGIGTVDERFRYKTNKETVTINNEITCTTNHEFYVINKCDKDKVNENNLHDFAYWIAAKDLDKDTHLLIKKYS